MVTINALLNNHANRTFFGNSSMHMDRERKIVNNHLLIVRAGQDVRDNITQWEKFFDWVIYKLDGSKIGEYITSSLHSGTQQEFSSIAEAMKDAENFLDNQAKND